MKHVWLSCFAAQSAQKTWPQFVATLVLLGSKQIGHSNVVVVGGGVVSFGSVVDGAGWTKLHLGPKRQFDPLRQTAALFL